MRLTGPVFLVVFALVAGLFLGASSAGASPSEQPVECLSRFAAALTSGDGAGVRAECSDAVWARVGADVDGAGRGTFVVLNQSVGRLREDLASGYVLWTHPDGVQDLLNVTLSGTGGAWKVSGGLGGGTSARPLAD